MTCLIRWERIYLGANDTKIRTHNRGPDERPDIYDVAPAPREVRAPPARGREVALVRSRVRTPSRRRGDRGRQSCMGRLSRKSINPPLTRHFFLLRRDILAIHQIGRHLKGLFSQICPSSWWPCVVPNPCPLCKHFGPYATGPTYLCLNISYKYLH